MLTFLAMLDLAQSNDRAIGECSVWDICGASLSPGLLSESGEHKRLEDFVQAFCSAPLHI